MSKRENQAFSIKEILNDLLQENKLQKGIDQLDVKEAWGVVMGKGVMSYTDSIVLKNNLLIVKLTSSTLREELSYGNEKIIQMLNTQLGKELIKSLKLV
ncbi:MAG: DUF721 domain-containing protein [Bacteroidota bacterium]